MNFYLRQYPKYYQNLIVIDSSSSRCGNCDKNAFPDERFHTTVKYAVKEHVFNEIIYPAEPGIEGCLAEWKYVTTNYMFDANLKAAILRQWPHLEWVGGDRLG